MAALNNKSDKNLARLLSSMELTSRDLAEMLHVHYSLVSKWLHQKRPLKQNSDHLKNLVSIVMSLDEPNHYSTIQSILTDTYPGVDFGRKENLRVYLSSFITADNDTPPGKEWWDSSNPRKIDHSAKLDVYVNDQGRQAALMRLLDSAAVLAPRQELMFFSDEAANWLLDYPDFKALWYAKHGEQLDLGNRTTIIHTINQQPSTIVHSITQWLPFHLMGRTKAYYFPRYFDNTFHYSLMVLKEHAAVMGLTAGSLPEPTGTYYSTDNLIVKQAEAMFERILDQSKPLFEELSAERNYIRHHELTQKKDDSYLYLYMPLELGLCDEDLGMLLRQNGIAGEGFDSSMSFFRDQRERLLNTLDTSTRRLIVNTEQLERNYMKGVPFEGFNLMTGEQILIFPEYIKKLLHGYAEVINSFDNLSIALVDDDLIADMPKIRLIIKKHSHIIASNVSPEISSPHIMKEPTLVMSFFTYFDDFWKSIPLICRDRDAVIGRLRKLCD